MATKKSPTGAKSSKKKIAFSSSSRPGLEKKKKAVPEKKASSKTPAKAKTLAKSLVTKVEAKKPAFDFIGTFPIRKDNGDKKTDLKKQPLGPVFPQGDYIVGSRGNTLSHVLIKEFESVYLGKHTNDTLKVSDPKVAQENLIPLSTMNLYSRELESALLNRQIDVAVLNMKDIPLELPSGLVLAAALRREDPRDALITRATYGAIQELPLRARIGTASKRRIMQVKNIRPDIELVPISGDVNERLEVLEQGQMDAVIVPWASLRRLNISPRYYVALLPELMTPAACQGTIGLLCRAESVDLINKLRYVEDSEASWSARCERAFLQKLSANRDSPVGVYAHRKGTQDPWILDAAIGDSSNGEVLRHREIGTSRCKPESLADKAFLGILSKGARKFLPFHS